MSYRELSQAGMHWISVLLKVVSASWKGWLWPWSVAGERAYSPVWLAEEEEGEGREVKDGLCLGLIMVLGEAGDEGAEDGDVDWPHPGGGGVLIGPGLEEGFEVKDIMDAIQPGIQEAQSGELLAHGM